ncbi:MAG: tRNA uridine-5-carboxymethylaminomethyl(34) synthesis enzyme MnmG [Candidatus Omnitrophota bacterium]|jgi:tRNA uridine 5-carboxymethylaminomethyl modification enzyme
MNNYDIIVIGAGHAGIEAALASSRMGCKTLMLTFDINSIGRMSCNPAIGGVGKGQLVREIDALGGVMGSAADACGIQFRMLNASKGAAVHSSRAQIDMDAYSQYMKRLVIGAKNLKVKEAEVKKIIVEDNKVTGVITGQGEEIFSSCVIICSGTFLDGLIHVGLKHLSGGRINEPASEGLADNLRSLGFNLLKFKTGTCPRLDSNSIDYSKLIVQSGDNPPKPFSFSTRRLPQKQVACHITYTNKNTHQIILDNLDQSPLYAGIIKSTGVRYCPSIEDKIVKFKDKGRHQVFLEPQGLNTREVYPNGISTSLPEDVQLKILHSIEGLENVKVIRFGYGIEHIVIEPTQFYPTLESKAIKGLYSAGQINGTTGYEEAAAQGLIAGINAALRIKNTPPHQFGKQADSLHNWCGGKEPFVLDRSTSYIGVLIDDLTTKGTEEPYRMFTSRVEYRLILREDNADARLSEMGYNLGLVSKKSHKAVEDKIEAVKKGIRFLKSTRVKSFNGAKLKKDTALEELLRRPEVNLLSLKSLGHEELNQLKFAVAEGIEIEVKYRGFIERQLKDVEKFKNLEKIKVPQSLDYTEIPSLSREIKEKLNKFKPLNLGQASRISGMTPAAISMLMVYFKKISHFK